MLTKMEIKERCLCICGSALWYAYLNFDSGAFPVMFLIQLSVPLEFLIYFHWKVKINPGRQFKKHRRDVLQKSTSINNLPWLLGFLTNPRISAVVLVFICCCSAFWTLNYVCSSSHCLPGYIRALSLTQEGSQVPGKRIPVEGVDCLNFISSKFVKSVTLIIVFKRVHFEIRIVPS